MKLEHVGVRKQVWLRLYLQAKKNVCSYAGDAGDQVFYQIDDQVENQVWSPVRFQVWDQVWEKLYEEVNR